MKSERSLLISASSLMSPTSSSSGSGLTSHGSQLTITTSHPNIRNHGHNRSHNIRHPKKKPSKEVYLHL